ncbi:T9SS type A sorting domain-containing protein [Segetibacter sp. 3557_3]|uniref:T9SS type A sorting domain-containing protein n=1 Tax=Segetibacter sp. 3557_3 TaxID=2547429 RepID=UPI001058DD99|nr:T9SS type A sorting domain-containing protein [Segetibacter sp. 3557_3]TDH27856.1 T9SS type A sorting domain-containing protein [Segetibacter sp. 3557_3]
MGRLNGTLIIAMLACAWQPVMASPAGLPGDTLKPVVESRDSAAIGIVQVSGKKNPGGAQIDWNIPVGDDLKQVNIQYSTDGNHFTTISTARAGTTSFKDDWPSSRSTAYYRLEILRDEKPAAYSAIVVISTENSSSYILLQTNPISQVAKLKISSLTAQMFSAEWRTSQGTLIQSQPFQVSAGVNLIQLQAPDDLIAGNYYLRVMSEDKKQRQLFRIVKQ